MPFDLHRALQAHYAGDDGATEARIGPWVVDVFRAGVVYEIQTRGFSALRKKVAALLDEHPVTVVYPVAARTEIVYCDGDPPVPVRRRTSPAHGKPVDVFLEAVHLARLLAHPNLAIEIPVVVVAETRVRREALPPARSRRRRRRKPGEWVAVERRLVAVESIVRLDTPADGLRFLPDSLAARFTSRMLAEALSIALWRAQKVTYVLREAGMLVDAGRTRAGRWYERWTE